MLKKIILDCDPGHDDAVAIMLAAANEDIEILGITCVGGNTTLENTKTNSLKICSLIGRTDLNIYSGDWLRLSCFLEYILEFIILQM